MNSVPSMEQQFVKKLIEIVEGNFNNEQFQVTDLATEMGMSRATLHRKVKAITGKTISQFINETRLNAAQILLSNRSATVSEVAYMVGFGSSTYFIKCFHDHFGYPPGEVLKENFQPIKSKAIENESRNKGMTLWMIVGIPMLLLLGGFLIYMVLLNNNDSQELPRPVTQNQAALNLYLQAIKLTDVYLASQDMQHCNEAEQKYREAIVLDSTFGDAYVRLAEIFLVHKPYNTFPGGASSKDIGNLFIQKAEHFGVGDTDYLLKIKAIYYHRILNYEEALRIFELRWEKRDKNYNYYSERGNHAYLMRDYGATIENLLAYLHFKPEYEIAQYDRLMKLALTFSKVGLEQEAQEFAYRQFALINDTANYQSWYPRIIYECGNLQKTIDYYEAAYQNYELGTTVYNKLLEMYMLTGQSDEGLKLLPQYIEYNEMISGALVPNYIVGYYHFLNKDEDLSATHFRSEIRRWEYFCEFTETQESLSNYQIIAACYAMLNDKNGAIRSLQKLVTKTSISYLTVLKLQKSPMFDKLAKDEDFLLIKKKIEKKYYEERELIKDALEDYPIVYSYEKATDTPLF